MVSLLQHPRVLAPSLPRRFCYHFRSLANRPLAAGSMLQAEKLYMECTCNAINRCATFCSWQFSGTCGVDT
eukprot:494119-Amphidinium_carterae.1